MTTRSLWLGGPRYDEHRQTDLQRLETGEGWGKESSGNATLEWPFNISLVPRTFDTRLLCTTLQNRPWRPQSLEMEGKTVISSLIRGKSLEVSESTRRYSFFEAMYL